MATTQQTIEGAGDAGTATQAEKPMRADARRNRQRLIDAAREVFDEQGVSASMEAIAKKAGVGVGTLYRHFPNRYDVVEAVYQDEVDELEEAARHAVTELEPWPAMEAYFDAFLNYARRKGALMSELQQAFEKHPEFRSKNRARIEGAIASVLDYAKSAGVVRPDIDGADVMQLLAPVCSNAAIPPEQSRRLVGMVLDGMRVAAVSSVAPASPSA